MREYRVGVPEESDAPGEAAAPRRPTVRNVFVLVVVLVAGFHLFAVTAAALPPNRYSDAVRPATRYLSPYFTQNWRLFAPNPISADRNVRFQGALREGDRIVTTDWIDWTAVELELVHHRLVGNRAGYVTNKAYTSLSTRFGAMNTSQRDAADVADPADAPTWKELADRLVVGPPAARLAARAYLLYDRSFTRLATEVLEGRYPDAKVVAVRYALKGQAVTPYENRSSDVEEREAARPTPVQRINGWRQPLQGSEAERRAVADFDRRHGGRR